MSSENFMSKTVSSLAIASLLLACGGTARIYQQDQNSATFVLEGAEDKALADAHKKMRAQCGAQGYYLAKRDTVVVGQENYSNENTEYEEQEDTTRDADRVLTNDAVEESEYSGGGSSAEVEVTDHGPGYEDTTRVEGSEYSGGGSSESHSIEEESEQEDTTRNTSGNTNTSTVEGTRNINEKRVTFVCGSAAAQ